MNIEKIEALLEKQIEILEKLETITTSMLDAPIDNIPCLMEERSVLLEHASEIKTEIRKTTAGDNAILSVINCTCDISELSDELNNLFQYVLKINLSVSRIKALDAEILPRIECERNSVLEKLETLNSSSNSVAGNYKRAAETVFSNTTLADSLNIRTI